MDSPLYAVEPLANLNAVVTAGIEKHEARAARPFDAQFDRNGRSFRE
jgi:hypothetical protein